MSGILKTVVIETVNGPVEINENDFDAKIHTLFSEKQIKPTTKKRGK